MDINLDIVFLLYFSELNFHSLVPALVLLFGFSIASRLARVFKNLVVKQGEKTFDAVDACDVVMMRDEITSSRCILINHLLFHIL